MFKNNYYKKNKDIVIVRRNGVQELSSGVVPKNIDKHVDGSSNQRYLRDFKHVVKPNVNKNNYENIRNIVENNDQESRGCYASEISSTISKPEVKNIKNKLNIV